MKTIIVKLILVKYKPLTNKSMDHHPDTWQQYVFTNHIYLIYICIDRMGFLWY